MSLPFSVALAVPGHRSALLRCMLESAAHELRARGIRWTVVGEANGADVTFRQRASQGPSGTELYADVSHEGGGVEQVRVDGPLRSAAMVTVLSRIARSLRSSASGVDSGGGSAAALRWLETWSEYGDGVLLEFCIGGQTVALVDTQHAQWHSVIGTATPDLEALLDRMSRETFTLKPANGSAATPGVPLKPLLWQMALTAGNAGLMPALSQPGELRLKGWPYLAAGGPRSFGDMIRHLRGGAVDMVAMRDLGLAPREELNGFLNACHACGYLQVMTAATAFGQRPGAARPHAPVPVNAPRRVSRTGGVIASIRRSLGIGAE